MIDDDIKFFRQNFSASSHSDFPDAPQKPAHYQTRNNNLQAPQQRKKLR